MNRNSSNLGIEIPDVDINFWIEWFDELFDELKLSFVGKNEKVSANSSAIVSRLAPRVSLIEMLWTKVIAVSIQIYPIADTTRSCFEN